MKISKLMFIALLTAGSLSEVVFTKPKPKRTKKQIAAQKRKAREAKKAKSKARVERNKAKAQHQTQAIKFVNYLNTPEGATAIKRAIVTHNVSKALDERKRQDEIDRKQRVKEENEWLGKLAEERAAKYKAEQERKMQERQDLLDAEEARIKSIGNTAGALAVTAATSYAAYQDPKTAKKVVKTVVKATKSAAKKTWNFMRGLVKASANQFADTVKTYTS